MDSSAEDILCSFADAEGKIVSALPREDFMRYLYNSTDALSKADVQILSLRFYDGETVSVPEFIDFFTQSTSSRLARSAAAAVRANLNMLQFEEADIEEDSLMIRTPRDKIQPNEGVQTKLHIAIQKLVLIWEVVESLLRAEFNDFEQSDGGGHLVSLPRFKDTLTTICGPQNQEKKVTTTKKKKLNSDIQPSQLLRVEDINLIASRFELGNRVDVKGFFDFFDDPNQAASGSFSSEPFRFSAEWSTLKRTTKRDLPNKGDPKHRNGDDEEKRSKARSGWSVARDARKQLAIINSMKEATKGKGESKPPIMKYPSDKSVTSEPKPALQQSSSSHDLSDTPGKLINELRPGHVRKPSVKLSEQTLVVTYGQDQQGFQEELERRGEPTGYLFTKSSLKSCLSDLSPLTTEKEIDAFVNELEYSGGTVSSADVISHMKLKLSEVNSYCRVGENKLGKEQAKNLEMSQRAIASREASIQALKSQTTLDPITLRYKQDPKAFSTLLVKYTVNGKGNSLTKDQLLTGLQNNVTGILEHHITTLLEDLHPKLRSKTNDYLISGIVTILKQRLAYASKIEKQLALEEKALIQDQQRATRIAERGLKIEKLKQDSVVDSITSMYKLNPSNFKKLLENLSVEKKKKYLQFDHLHTILQSFVINVTDLEIQQLQKDLISLVAKDTNQLLISSLLTHLKSKSQAALNIFKELQKEESAQAKDVAASLGKKTSRGFCGGTTKDVHDPHNVPSSLPKDFKENTIDNSLNPPQRVIGSHDQETNELLHSPDEANPTEKLLKPKSSPLNKISRNPTNDTVDTLTFSDGGDEKSDGDDGHSQPTGGVALPGLTRWRKGEGIGFNEPKKTSKNQSPKEVCTSR